MSAAGPAGPTEEQVTAATFDRINAETRKLMAEQSKLMAEQIKLAAEGRKFNRDIIMLILGFVLVTMALRLPNLIVAFGCHS